MAETETPRTPSSDEEQHNHDDGAEDTLEQPREHDEGGEESTDTIPDA